MFNMFFAFRFVWVDYTGFHWKVGRCASFLLGLNKSPFLKEGPQKGKGILYHPRNIYQQGELDKGATCKEILQVQTEAGRLVQRTQPICNLDVIISVFIGQKSIKSLSEVMRATRIVAKSQIPTIASIIFIFVGHIWVTKSRLFSLASFLASSCARNAIYKPINKRIG